MEGFMIQLQYPDNSYSTPDSMDTVNRQIQQTQPMQTSPFLVPGVTPGTTSPGVTGYPAGAIRPLSYGVDLPPQQAAQMFGPTMVPEPGPPFEVAPGSPTALGPGYIQGFLRTQIGQRVRIEFLIGTNSFLDRRGTLIEVGVDHVVIREQESDDLLRCDIFDIKFVTIYR
jgi:hypothetical protein